ncbi:ABC transporter substrate-binding protein [Aquincola sp. S2]|uniref:ABC transporter substrate-binding protein n=1 Tax=Pseudaquabacterium terrae TaxID=2732868 RepID=A0ABX2ELB0_9BURK|nr:ABC transporter substrate-binding protein [Aquabacterium terrae]NRF69352.1 ABC transporter substrate-binding protein [Aquabacterium terrae]
MQQNIIQPFRDGLRARGRIEGQDHVIEFRYHGGRYELLPAQIDELLQWKVDLLVTLAPRATRVAQQATSSVPILAVAVDNPVVLGFARSLARPGGNITGISSWGIEMVIKRLELVRELLPKVRRVGMFSNPQSIDAGEFALRLEELGRTLGLQITLVLAEAPEQFVAAFERLKLARAEAVVVLADSLIYVHRARIAELCTQYRLPSVWGGRDYLHGGGLASYQSDFPDMFRRAGVMADQLLKGADPAEMPFERASKFHLVVNLKAARALGLTVPRTLLLAADEVLE